MIPLSGGEEYERRHTGTSLMIAYLHCSWHRRLHHIQSWLVSSRRLFLASVLEMLESSPPLLCFDIFYRSSRNLFVRFWLGMKICHLHTLVGGDGEILVVDLKREPGGLGILLALGRRLVGRFSLRICL